MKQTKDIINQMEKEFNRRVWTNKMDLYPSVRTLLESFGEEIMSASIGAIPTSDDYAKGWNDSRQENYKVKSLKVKEIINLITK